MSKKKVLAITGIRSEYEILFPVIDALRNDPGIDLKLAVSGAHLSDWHGDTFKKIEEDGFEAVDRIDNLLLTNRKTQRAKGVGNSDNRIDSNGGTGKPGFSLCHRRPGGGDSHCPGR